MHSDYRNGNLIVDPEKGVVAVLDWELAHIGDPMRDLGWLVTRSWRFGVADKDVGGFGDLDDLIAGYETVSGEHGRSGRGAVLGIVRIVLVGGEHAVDGAVVPRWIGEEP